MFYRIVFSFKENYADIAVIRRGINSIKIKKAIKIHEHSETNISSPSYAFEESLNKIKELREKTKIRNKDVNIILNWDNIITRVIETPIMNKKELKKFIDNNIEDYFAVSMNDYCYDYEVICLAKKGEKGKMSIMLAAVPRSKVKEILDFIKLCGLSPKSIGIYPNYISNLFDDEKDKSIAVLDVNNKKSTLTILDKGEVFLYSNIPNESYDSDREQFVELYENLEYFLNFYSTRHFGNRVDRIYILGELYNNEKLLNLINSQVSMEVVSGLSGRLLELIKKSPVNGNIYSDIIGSYTSIKNIYNKKIDFADKLFRRDKKERSVNRLILLEIEVFSIITIFVTLLFFIYSKISIQRYDTTSIDRKINLISSIENEAKELESEKQLYENKIENMKKIQKDEFDYITIFDSLRRGMPQDILIKSITVDKENVNITVSINNSTLDGAKTIIALNKINIFEPVELPQIKLNDDLKELRVSLKIKKT
ncbi:pilus assembly protein PilM [Clostridium magnum]|uniref:Competence protein A n=1 Tax=Clostridium magnum DSM 2767 TaxID=1121326 RepID=A0A161XFR6_9CLOT|nr:pilus assembly protein PilM [Clostridium magnum]KZL93386.1 competence protein A [Clostridium magnum DSM 2767]SHI16009.1 type IV pilus assembly protein PilM [Clostridium magnum DSM 2767]